MCLQCRSLLTASRRNASTAAVPAATVTDDADVITPSTQGGRDRKTGFAMKTYKPRTPGIRHLVRPINDHLWKGGPHRPLTYPKIGQSKGGRNNSGRVTVRHHGGGHRRRIRTVDFVRAEPGKQIVERIEYDPNRSAHLALLEHSVSKVKSYIIASEGMRAGDVVESFRAGITKELLNSMGGVIDPGLLAAKTAFRGNCLPMRMIPLGTQIYCLGSQPKKGAVFCRSAGTYATVISRDEEDGKVKDVTVRLQSNELRRVAANACATIGVASNPTWQFRQLGKAGRSRWLNIRPTVRGVAMNAVDHPHGGGRGKSKGNVHPVSIWGTPVSTTLFSGGSADHPRPKVDSRHVRRGTLISFLYKIVLEIKAREGQIGRRSMCTSSVTIGYPASMMLDLYTTKLQCICRPIFNAFVPPIILTSICFFSNCSCPPSPSLSPSHASWSPWHSPCSQKDNCSSSCQHQCSCLFSPSRCQTVEPRYPGRTRLCRQPLQQQRRRRSCVSAVCRHRMLPKQSRSC